MELKQCENGHFYNSGVHATCPYCSGENANATIGVQPVPEPVQEPVQFESMNHISDDIGKTVAGGFYNNTNVSSSAKDPRTVAMIKKETGIDPVVGWLVALNGKEIGKDYRVHADNNFIGRGENMDICVRGDDTISRENHAILSYDMEEKSFYLTPGSGRSIVRLNGKSIFTTAEMKAYDQIKLGNTVLAFMPFCGEEFDWTEN